MGSKRWIVLVIVVAFGATFWFLVERASTPSLPTNVPISALTPEAAPAQKDDLIVVTAPLPGATVQSPLVIKGKARGNWFFEGTFPVVLTDWDGKIIAQGYAKANPPAGGEWMTTEYVPFTASLSYTLPPQTPYRTGFLILKKDNPSGEPQFDNSLEIKITL